MTQEEETGGHAGETFRHTGRLSFEPTGDTSLFRAHGAPRAEGEVRLLIHFDGSDYPFEKHYRHARHRGGETPYTFGNTEFSDGGPGLLVGPWPGWRGIPSFPGVRVISGGKTAPVSLMGWGDELAHRAIRGAAAIEISPEGVVLCETADPGLRPLYADIYSGPARHAAARQVTLLPSIERLHPRILVTPRDIPLLREKARGSHHDYWERIVSLLDGARVPWEVTPESKVPPGPERLSAADRSLMAAAAAIIDPSPARRSGARESFLLYIEETRQAGYQPLAIDTQAGETLFVLSASYDWTHDLWTEDEREEIEGWVRNVAGICWSHLGYERRDYGQAHYLGCALGLLAFSFLFWDRHPRSREWAAHCRGVLESVIEMIPRDGFYPHGINLWIYEYGFLLRWLELFRVCTGTDFWHPAERWRNSSAFRGASVSPDGLYGAAFGDPQYRVGGDSWCHYLIAARTSSREAQRLGDLLREIPPSGVDFRSAPPRRRVYEFLFHDDSIDPGGDGESVIVFRDGGQVFVRGEKDSPWLFTFRSGAPLGRQRYRAGEAGGYGHADPANGSFLLFGGSGPAICGPGPTYRRDTSLHNTITFNGRGQVGDSTVWLPDFLPPEFIPPDPEFRIGRRHVLIRAELAPSYLPLAHVEECLRTLCISPGRWIVGRDSIRSGLEESIEWNIHAWEIDQPRSSGGMTSCDLGSPGNLCRLSLIEPRDAVVETGLTEMVPAYPNDGTRVRFLRASVRTRETRFVWCILIDRSLGPPDVTGDADRISIRFAGGETIRFSDGFLTPD